MTLVVPGERDPIDRLTRSVAGRRGRYLTTAGDREQ
jgi:hypothetical protein